MNRLLASALGLVLCSACVSPDSGDLFGTAASTMSAGDASDATSVGDASADASGASASADGSTSGASDTDNTKFDTPGGSATMTGGDGGTGCEKIDFLFVIDNSGSMAPHQANLIANFGPFMDTIAAEVQGMDYHVMAIDSDACPNMLGSCTPTSCEDTLGAGQVRNCNVPNGLRYLTSDLDLATIKSTFECTANVGDQGSAEEMPMTGMVEAIGPLNSAGECNDGFVRDDAILVVTVISDDHSGWFGNDNENGYGGTPESWYADVIAVKGKPENVVVLSLVALLDDQSCIGFGPEESDQFIAFTEMFGAHGIVASVCEQDYNQFFQSAVGLIDTTCDEFEPEG
jgi:hypothetical protein